MTRLSVNDSKDLTYILGPGAGDDQGPPPRLLQHPVAVHLPVERLPILLPAVSETLDVRTVFLLDPGRSFIRR